MKVRVNWGVGVALIYGLFAASTLGFVAFALAQPVDLVSADYYAQSLTVDARAGAVRRADALGARVRIDRDEGGQALLLTLPAEHADATGTVTLYRPANAGFDRVMTIARDAAGIQRIPTAGLARGRWIVKVDWQIRGDRFYREQPIDLR